MPITATIKVEFEYEEVPPPKTQRVEPKGVAVYHVPWFKEATKQSKPATTQTDKHSGLDDVVAGLKALGMKTKEAKLRVQQAVARGDYDGNPQNLLLKLVSER